MSKVLTRRCTTGETTARTQRGHKPPKLAPFYTSIREHVAGHGDTTIEKLRGWLLATHQIKASVGLQLNTNFGYGPHKRTQNILNVQPVIPIDINANWNIITRTIMPLVWNPSLQPASTVPFWQCSGYVLCLSIAEHAG